MQPHNASSVPAPALLSSVVDRSKALRSNDDRWLVATPGEDDAAGGCCGAPSAATDGAATPLAATPPPVGEATSLKLLD